LDRLRKGVFINADIAIGEEKYELDYENHPELPENQIVYY
jgi:hypothetical protein